MRVESRVCVLYLRGASSNILWCGLGKKIYESLVSGGLETSVHGDIQSNLIIGPARYHREAKGTLYDRCVMIKYRPQ